MTEEQLTKYQEIANQYNLLSDPRGRLAGIIDELIAEVRRLRQELGRARDFFSCYIEDE